MDFKIYFATNRARQREGRFKPDRYGRIPLGIRLSLQGLAPDDPARDPTRATGAANVWRF